MTRTSQSLAARIAHGDPVYGVIVKMPSPALVEMAGHTGFDLVVIDTEHGTADNSELEHHLRAADSAGVPVLVRIGSNDPLATLRALDAGAAGVIVPHVSSADQARAAVANAHYPPMGTRGLAVSTRAGRHGNASMREHLASAAENTVVVAQVEDKEAAKRSEEIAHTPGLNAVWIGPSDLSMSLGLPGQLDHPEVVAAVDRIAADVLSSPACALCVLVDNPGEAEDWLARGARIVLFSSTSILANGLRGIIESRRTGTSGSAPSDRAG